MRGGPPQDSEATSATIAAGPNVAYRVVEDIVSLMQRLASAGPVVLALDDLQWADPSTVVALHALTRRLRYVPVGIVCAYRPSPRSPELARFIEAQTSAGATQLTLGGLGEHDIGALTAAVLGAPRYLPVEPGEILTLAAVLGGSFDVVQLALVARRPVVELMASWTKH